MPKAPAPGAHPAEELPRLRELVTRLSERNEALTRRLDMQTAELADVRRALGIERSSRKLAEEALDETRSHLRLAMDAAQLAWWEWRDGESRLYLSERWGMMIDEMPIEGAWSIADLRRGAVAEDLQALDQQLRELLPGRIDRMRVVLRYPVGAGTGTPSAASVKWLEVVGMVTQRNEAGRALRLSGTIVDVTQRHLAAQALAQARDEAEAASRAKSALLANVSHEVRTPLHAILGLSQVLLAPDPGAPLTDEQAQQLRTLQSAARTMLDLLNDVLDLSRLEAGRLPFEQLPFDLPGRVEETWLSFEPLAQSKGLQTRLVIDPALPRSVRGDPMRLRQVLGNLLSNAIKFTSRGGVGLAAQLMQGAAPAGRCRVVLTVQDTGVGIAEADLRHLFRPFSQADSSTARRFGGTGLGLAICDQLVRAMGGCIQVHSRPGQGSRFRVELPLELAEVGADGPAEGESRFDTDFLQGRRVLVVDDHEINRLVARKLLEPLGCEVVDASDGLQALASWERGGIDVVLMDIQMPGLTGIDATARLRMRAAELGRPRTPVLALTARALPGDREQLMAQGMDGYIAKPFELDELVQAIHAAMESAQAAAPPATSEAGAVAALVSAGVGVPTGVSLLDSGIVVHSQPPLDLDKLRSRLAGNEAALQRVAELLRRDLSGRLNTLVDAGRLRNTAAACREAHTLRGALLSVTAERGGTLLQRMEMAARSQEWSAYERLLAKLQIEAHRIDQVLGDILRTGG